MDSNATFLLLSRRKIGFEIPRQLIIVKFSTVMKIELD